MHDRFMNANERQSDAIEMFEQVDYVAKCQEQSQREEHNRDKECEGGKLSYSRQQEK